MNGLDDVCRGVALNDEGLTGRSMRNLRLLHRQVHSVTILLVVMTLPSLVALAAEERKFTKEQLDFFESQVRPILAKNCQGCHGKKGKPKGGQSADAAGACSWW